MALPGANVMLVGATGTGKTYSVRSLLDSGVKEVFILFTEPGMEVVGDISCDKGLHYHYIPPANAPWTAMIDSAKKINQFDQAALSKLTGINTKNYAQFIEVLQCCNNFTCDRCGKEFGDISSWGTDRAFVLDSLSGLNVMAMDLVVGSKPVKSMADWGIAMDNLERLIQKLTTDTKCHFVMITHLEREHDEATGSTQLMASTLGKKLAPRMPRFFSDVVHVVRKGDKFKWSTSTLNVDLKARNLPLSTDLEPSFKELIAEWLKHGGEII